MQVIRLHSRIVRPTGNGFSERAAYQNGSFQIPSYEFRITNHESRVPSYEFRIPRPLT